MIRIIPTLLIIFLIQGCGYHSIHKIDRFDFTIIKFNTTGDKKINRELNRNFEKFQTKGISKRRYEIIADSKINRKVKSRDSAGIAENLLINLSIKVTVIENGNIISERLFQRNNSYTNLENKFELSQYELIILQNLNTKIIKKINLYISSLK
tara:strand:+ start:4529 stop:4987 length:459 start_codon:yes stop_codon:yes gene_type:complete